MRRLKRNASANLLTSMIFTLLLLVCIGSALAVLPMKRLGSLTRTAWVGSTFVMVLSLVGAWPTLFHGSQDFLNGTWHVDPFAAFLVLLVGIIQWTATLVSLPYIQEEFHEKKITFTQARLYFLLVPLFVFSMILTLIVNNIGLMWVALEGTTLATTMLVAFYTTEGSLEAAWKYIILCSAGISLGLLGVLLMFYAAVSSGHLPDVNALTWTSLHAVATQLPPQIVRWAFIFIFIGYGAKVGLVPLHTWLPDAHGRTPSPISALLSGVLLNIALFAILRYRAIVDLSLGSSTWTNGFFLIFGTMSFLLPAAFILTQKNYKRLLAYSSIEHMGFMVFCFAFGLPGAVAALVHMLGHAFTKSLLFFGAGNILLRWKSTKIDHVGRVMKYLSYTGTFFLLGLLILLAIPPSPLFLSEYWGLMAAVHTHPVFVVLLLVVGTVIFAGMMRQIIPLLYAPRNEDVDQTLPGEKWNLSHAAMLIHVCILGAVGVGLLLPPARLFLESLARSLS